MRRSRSPCYSALLVAAAVIGCTANEPAVVGATTKLKASEAWDRSARLSEDEPLTLVAARGEVLGLQVLVKKSSVPVALSLPAEVADVRGFRVGFVDVEEPSTDMYGPSRGAGSYPDVLWPSASPITAEREAFLDVHVREHAPAGDHRGALSIGKKTFDVILHVVPARIDLTKDPLVWVFYLPRAIARAHELADDDSAEQIAIEARYHALFREHGAYLATGLGPERFPPRRRFVRDVKYWPVAVRTDEPEHTAEDVRTWLDYFESLDVTPFTIPVDEPRTLRAREHARDIAEIIGKAGGGRPRLLRAVTDRVRPLYGDCFDLYFSPDNIPEPAESERSKGVRFWTYNGRPPAAGSMIIDTDGTALRTWGWLAFRYDIELWYAWEGLYFSDRYNGDDTQRVPSDPITFDERHRGGTDFGNGDGVLAYPGPVPSLRLKALRRGLQDRLLLLELSRCGHPALAERIARSVVARGLGEATATAAWPKSESRWEQARQHVLHLLETRCRA